MTTLERGQLLSDEQYFEAMEEFGDEFEALMGAEAIKALMGDINLEEEVQFLREEIRTPTAKPKLKSFPSGSSCWKRSCIRAISPSGWSWKCCPFCRRICALWCPWTVAALPHRI